MDIKGIFLDNYVMLYELIGLLVIMGVSAHLSDRMKRLTVIVVVLLILEAVVFRLEQWTQTFETLSIARPLLTALLYSLYPMILMTLTFIIGTDRFTRTDLFIAIPWAVCVPVFFTSQWTRLVAWYSAPNNYHGGPLANLPYFLFAFYLAVFLVHNYIYFRHSALTDKLTMSFVVLVPVVGVLLYVIENSGRDYNAIFISSAVLYYMYIYTHMSRIDPLTELQNRQSYYRVINSSNRSITGVASVDMNDLKYFNDNLGHEAGDEALRVVSAIMRENCGKGGTAYRVGGDEFMIIYIGASEMNIADAIEVMQEKMSRTPYMCAFGYAMTRPGDTIEDTIRTSDQRMYENKIAMKASR